MRYARHCAPLVVRGAPQAVSAQVGRSAQEARRGDEARACRPVAEAMPGCATMTHSRQWPEGPRNQIAETMPGGLRPPDPLQTPATGTSQPNREDDARGAAPPGPPLQARSSWVLRAEWS
jgi:hypothetical protein